MGGKLSPVIIAVLVIVLIALGIVIAVGLIYYIVGGLLVL